jgi:hypothetical protein
VKLPLKARLNHLGLGAIALSCALTASSAPADEGWFPFTPNADPLTGESAIDLRFLNETFAGEHGWIEVKDGEFVHGASQEPLRFWAVNGPPHDLKGTELKRCARLLAKYGVNLVRVHGGYFDKDGEVHLAKVQHAFEIVEVMKAEGIYTYFSIYFPLWLAPNPETPWLKGYNGQQHPFAALFFNRDFQAQYRKWWTALLTTRSAITGQALIDEPAVAGLEMQNEDSFFFWTFSQNNIPDPQLRILEKQFGDWLAQRYGSVEAALARWNSAALKRDQPAEGRVAFRPLWNMFKEKTARDQDTVRFLFEVQTRFYTETHAFLRTLGFRAPITASNWATASPEVFGPLEKLSYTVGEFIDRHGYFSCNHKGPFAEWSLRDGQTYSDRSALRFEAEDLNQPRQFVHPAMDPHYDGKPSMISETTWTRPNRFRSEAPLYLAAYGALQHTDAIVHFAFDGAQWSVKPGFWMQPWTLMSPAMFGQFPAAALIYRQGLIRTGAVLAEVILNKQDLLLLKGTPLPQDAALDELQLKSLPSPALRAPSPIGWQRDPLLHYAGRVNVTFTTNPGSVRAADTQSLIDHSAQSVTSSTGELKLEYGRGLLRIDAAAAQGFSGRLQSTPALETQDLVVSSTMELGHIIAVSLDHEPLRSSKRILLQVMSEEKATGFQTEPVAATVKRIRSIGQNPWLVRHLNGTVRFKRPDAGQLKVRALDERGYPAAAVGTAQEINLSPNTLYYLITQ